MIYALTAFIVLCYLLWEIARRKKKPVNKLPVAGDPLEYYDLDYVTLSRNIERAKTLLQMDYARQAICDFKKDYLPYQNAFSLQRDVNMLRRKYKDHRVTILTRMQILN